MRGRWWEVIAALVAAGSLSLSLHSTGSPAFAAQAAAGIAYSGALDGAMTTARLGAPAAAVWRRSIAWASSAASAPSRSVVLTPSAFAVLPTRMTCASPAFWRAGRAELVERGLRGVRHVLAVGEQHGRAQRPAHQLGGGDRRAPVLGVDERDHGGAGVARARGVDRLGDARGVGDRVGAAHARGVLRRETGEAEALGRLVVVAALADDGLALVAVVRRCRPRRSRRRAGRAASSRRQRPAGHDRGHASRCPTRRPHKAEIRRRGRTCSSDPAKADDHRLDITRHRGIQCRASNAESPGHAGERGTQLCGASQVLSDLRRELFQRQPVS